MKSGLQNFFISINSENGKLYLFGSVCSDGQKERSLKVPSEEFINQTFSAVELGEGHGMAVLDTKPEKLLLWGKNEKHCLSVEKGKTAENQIVGTRQPLVHEWQKPVKSISARGYSSALMTEGGAVFYWGEFDSIFDKPLKLSTNEYVTQITVGKGYLIVANGTISTLPFFWVFLNLLGK